MTENDKISAVSLKLPPPWMNHMEMWLHVVESQFVTRGITQELSKFHYVVAALTLDLASCAVRSSSNQCQSLRDPKG